MSRVGVEVCGVTAKLKIDEVIGVTHGANKVHFRVKWMGQPGTPSAGCAGLENLTPEKPLWSTPLPEAVPDSPQKKSLERRRHPRIKCVTSVEIHPEGGAVIWGKATDLSIGGCYVEMPIPLKSGTKLRVGIWMGSNKTWVKAVVTNSTPGFGIGVQFTTIDEKDTKLLKEFLSTIPAF